MSQWGSYVVFTEEPETDKGKAEYVKQAVSKLIEQMIEADVEPNWNTMQLIIKEGIDIFSSALSWYEGEAEDEEEEYIPDVPSWRMTVALKVREVE